MDDAEPAMLDRHAIAQERAALIASLWPEARPCAVRAVYEVLPAPTLFATALSVQWAAPPAIDAHALQARLHAAFPARETAAEAENVRAA